MTPFSLGPSPSMLDVIYVLATQLSFVVCLPVGDLILHLVAGDLGILDGSGGQNDHG